MVEGIVLNVVRRSTLTYDLQDLAQITYVALLETEEWRLQDLWENGEMRFYIARIVSTQWFSPRSTYCAQVTRWQRRAQQLKEVPDEP